MAARLTTFIVVAIVTVTLIAGLIVGAKRDDGGGPIDLIVYNGRVLGADGLPGDADAVAVRGNVVARVGKSRELRRLRRNDTVEIDARGGSILPGFNDAHLHFISGGLGLERVNLLDATTLDQIRQAITTFAAANPSNPWVIGRGWYYEPFPGSLPTRQLLDELVPDRPAYMVAYDGHTAWANSRALAIAGVTRETPNPPDGIVVKDPVTGEPTGVFKEAAKGLIAKFLPELTREQQLRALRNAIAAAHEVGITSVQNAHGDAEEFTLFEELKQSGDLKVRVYTAYSIDEPITEADADAIDALRARHGNDPFFRTGAIKIMGDGVIESHTAAMLAPYSNAPGSGATNLTDEQLRSIVTTMDKRGWQIMIHAIGDRAIRQALDAFEHAAAVNGPRDRRHRIEHIETTDPADIPRFKALGVVASMQPFHANPNPNQINVWSANIGDERASRGWIYGTLAKSGARVVFGSDWPVVTVDPRFGINMALNRTTPEGTPPGGWYPKEKMALADVIAAYTSDAAYAQFEEHTKGRLAPGQFADIVVMSKDLFALAPARIMDAVVTHTIVDGKVVYVKDGDHGGTK